MSYPIPRKDYETIFRVLRATSSAMGNTRGFDCQFMNIVGAALVAKHYISDARPIMGGAFFYLHKPTHSVLSLGKVNKEEASAADAFHCWIEAGGYAIDFTAPNYKETLDGAGNKQPIPRKMFQKPLNQMVSALDDFKREGDFFLVPNPELTAYLLKKFFAKPAGTDLMNVCFHWFKKPPAKTDLSMSIIDDLGKIKSMTLPSMYVSSAW